MDQGASPAPIATTLGIISKPMHVKLLQTFALTASALQIGQFITLSLMTVPSLLQTPSPRVLARQWWTFFNRGKIIGPACIFPSSLIFGWLAWREPSARTSAFKLYTVASVLLASTIPYTELLMIPTIKELWKRTQEDVQADVEAGDVMENYKSQSTAEFLHNRTSKDSAEPEQQSVHHLVDNWAILNVGRGVMCSIASLCGMWATMDEDMSFFELLP